jgi:hypothetical protein
MKRIVTLVWLALAGTAWGQQPGWTDPYVPPHVKRVGPPPIETRGDALKAQVERKLRDQFDAADTAKSGMLTRAQAQAAGFGYVAENFDAIDTRRAGVVRFEDLKRYLGL